MVRQASALILSLASATALLIGPTPPVGTAAEFMRQGPFWQADLAAVELEDYTADSLASAGLPETVAQAAATARDDLQRVLALSADGVTLLGSSRGGALLVVPRGWLSLENLAGSFGPLYAHTLQQVPADDTRLSDMPYVAAWRDLVGLFGGRPRYGQFCVLGQWAFCAASDDRLLYSEIGSGQWHDIGHANKVVALGALDEGPAGWDDHDRLFVATRDNELWARRAVLEEIGWEKVGHARNVIALCGAGESLFCVTSGDRLWQRPAEGGDVEWQQVGGAPGVASLMGLAGRLYYADGQGTLYASDPGENPGAWQRISSIPLQPFDLPE